MTFRILILASSALLLTAVATTGADAATRHSRRHAAAHHRAGSHGMAMRGSRGGDAQNSTVDQLNAQSLAAARGGAAPAPAAQ